MKIVNVVFLFTVLTTLLSCNSKDNFEQKMNTHDRLILENSFETGDVHSAIYSIQSLLSRDTNNLGLMDTLTNLYLQIGNQQSAFNLSGKILEQKPENIEMLEIRGKTAANIRRAQIAVDVYSKLFEIDKNTRYLYEIAVQSFNTGNISYGKKVVETIINSPRSKTDLYSYKLPNGQIIEIPVKAVAHYFIGSYEEINGEKAEAMNHYQKALEIYPKYGLAANKLRDLLKL